MANELLRLDLKSILLVVLAAGFVLMIPMDTVEPFKITYQAPVIKESQIPVQVEKNNIRYSATIGVEESWVTNFYREHPDEWVTGSFKADEPISLSLHDTKNYLNFTNNIEPVYNFWSTTAYAEEFKFEPPPVFSDPKDTDYYLILVPDKPTKVSIKLVVHWYETEYETRYNTENETFYKTEYKIVKKPLYNILMS